MPSAEEAQAHPPMRASDIKLQIEIEKIETDKCVAEVAPGRRRSSMRGIPSAEEAASCFAKAFFTFVSPLAYKGVKAPLEYEDLPPTVRQDKTVVVFRRLDRLVPEGEKRTIVTTILAVWWRDLINVALWKQPSNLAAWLRPNILNHLLLAMAYPFDTKYEVFGYEVDTKLALGLCVAALLLNQILGVVTEVRSDHLSSRVSLQVKHALSAVFTNRLLSMGSSVVSSFGQGRILNIIAVDVEMASAVFFVVGMIFTLPVRICLLVPVMIEQTGLVATLAALGLTLLGILLQSAMSRILKAGLVRLQKAGDARIGAMGELIDNMKIVKYYAWETSIMQTVEQKRAAEVHQIWRLRAFLEPVMKFLGAMPLLVTGIMFLTWALADGAEFTVTAAFVTVNVLTSLTVELGMLPLLFFLVQQHTVSVRRLQEVLTAPRLETREEPDNPSSAASTVSLSECEFAWPGTQSAFRLKLNLNALRGSMVGVVGQTGSGKSSLLLALLGEMKLLSGSSSIPKGRVLYVPQEAFIFNGTIRDNILFGADFDRLKYLRALAAASLGRDLSLLAGGDATEIGDKGINLSGGQKQRVSIARAVYHADDVVLALLDDPLSALDAEVAKAVNERAFLKCMREVTRILATNRVEFLSSCDQVCVLENGELTCSGTYADVAQSSKLLGEVARALPEASSHADGTSGEGSDKESLPSATALVEQPHASGVATDDAKLDAQNEDHSTSLGHSSVSEVLVEELCLNEEAEVKGEGDATEEPEQGAKDLVKDGQLTEAEKRTYGFLGWQVIASYFTVSGGWTALSVVSLLVILEAVSKAAAPLWLTQWIEMDVDNTHGALVYLGIGVFNAFILMLTGVACVSMFHKASLRLHTSMCKSMLRSPMSFFDVNPYGRIMTRFTKDMAVADMEMPNTVVELAAAFASFTAAVVIIVTVAPVSFLGFVPVLPFLHKVRKCYNASSRELQRLLALRQSIVIESFSQNAMGLSTIRAYQCEQHFLGRMQAATDRCWKVMSSMLNLERWLQIRLELTSALLMGLVVAFCAAARDFISPAVAGMAITEAAKLSGLLGGLIRIWTGFEVKMNAIERLVDYTVLQEEAPAVVKDCIIPADWPSKGVIELTNVWLSYRPGLPAVLRGVNLQILSRHKVGIVGRTGAGKSSTLLALFRMVEPSSGQIMIDGKDISKLGLRDLRSRLSIIPQTPCIFKSTLRMDVDPDHSGDDQALWAALKAVGLEAHAQTALGGLDGSLDGSQQSLSVGQCQLLCLARAAFRKARIVVMDEATSALDVQTDARIQTIVREVFRESTMLTIAHRLQTIIDSDRIAVMDAGVVVEYDAPYALLQKQTSVFASLVEETGDAQRLRQLAADAAAVHDEAY